MSYSRPAATAANLTWAGSTAYARPAETAANLSFLAGPQVSGFMPVAFGTPTMLPQIAGFRPITFGTPRTTALPVTGFAATNFGTPVVDLSQAVTGFAPAQFGAVGLAIAAVGFKATRFGTGSVLLRAVGFEAMQFGASTIRQVNRVGALRTCHFGTPTVPTTRTAGEHGFISTRFGHPVAIKYAPS